MCIPRHTELYKLPVVRTAETQIRNMIGDVSCRMCQFEQGGVQALVDQQFRHYAFLASLYRAMCNGFCFAQGRRARRRHAKSDP